MTFQLTAKDVVIRGLLRIILLACLGVVVLPQLCSAQDTQDQQPDTKKTVETSEDDNEGEQLWTANCGRCHNKISPETFNDKNWTTIMQHMRARGNLTGEEALKVLDFLKVAND